MNMERERRALLTISAGVATGAAAAAGMWLWRRRTIPDTQPEGAWAAPRGSAQEVSESLRDDPKLSRRRIEVDAIAEGVVELSGSVRDRTEADRAVGLAQGTTGVYTVVNRLRIEAEESRRESTRRRWDEGAPELRERHHHGMGVGMGTPRHAARTDPDRPNDKQRIIERELDVAKVEDDGPESPESEVRSIGAVDDPFMKPGDERSIREAGLDPSPGGGEIGAGDEGVSEEPEAAGEEGRA